MYQISGSQAMARGILVLEDTLIPFLSTIISQNSRIVPNISLTNMELLQLYDTEKEIEKRCPRGENDEWLLLWSQQHVM